MMMQCVRMITLFLCGDVMTGRGIDQILRNSCDPVLYEPYVRSAVDYVNLAERKNGPIPRNVSPTYIWGDALSIFDRVNPDLKIINLETTLTLSNDYAPKGINYRMHPKNVDCLQAAKVDCCVLANNHMLDWGQSGLLETLTTLRAANIKYAGAGKDRIQAQSPAEIEIIDKHRVVVYSFGLSSSGVPAKWQATDTHAGVNYLKDLSRETIRHIQEHVSSIKRSGDIAIASIHWGSNWNYNISRDEVQFAHNLIDEAGIDIVHGHSSHHPKGIEVYRRKLILYGCGDFINDYEGISGHEEYRGDLGLMYFPSICLESGELNGLLLVPTQMRRFQVKRASQMDSEWLAEMLNRESERFGSSFKLEDEGIVMHFA